MSESESEENYETITQWLDFFADAGIPPSPAAQYAVNFSEQRIPMNKAIILELSHDELKELGVNLLGDRLAIKNCPKFSNKKDMRKKTPTKPRPKIEKPKVENRAEKPVATIETEDEEISRIISSVKSSQQFPPSTITETSKICKLVEKKGFDYMGENSADEDEKEAPVQFSVNLTGLPRKRQQNDPVETDIEPKVVRPFSSGLSRNKKSSKIQEDRVSSSTPNFSITLGEGTRIHRKNEEDMRLPRKIAPKQRNLTIKTSVHNRLGRVVPQRKSNIKYRLGP